MANTPIRRCAIYTRKSSEEGLEQDFNSLHAQREACEAFIRSQAGEGWKLINTAYDDGGFSGGTMERPALQRLLADIRERLIDVVVVYKVDRLTRSLADFARMVELLDAHGVSFVAVTQQFNTITSMGRLTLNVLLSFAQFEREVIGERIRDKVAASKCKGIWMGGGLPMGYDVRERRLVVNQDEAQIVRHLFERYLELGSVRLLKKDLAGRGILSGTKVSKNGNRRGGKPFSRGALYHLLSNPVYVGEIRHKQERHPGLHEPIVSRELWEQVQQRLRSQAARHGQGRKTEAPRSPLAGKLFDVKGEPLYVQGAAKGQRRYRYYVSRTLVRSGSEEVEHGWRVSAPELERAVSAVAQEILSDRAAIARTAEEGGIDTNRFALILKSVQGWIERLRPGSEAASALQELIERVELRSDGVRVSVKLPIRVGDEGNGMTASHLALSRFVPMQMKRRGVEMKMVLQGASTPDRVDPPLLKAVARARRWAGDLASGRMRSVAELARREGMDGRSVRRLISLGFLSPRIVEAIADGRQPPDLTVIALTRRLDLPLLWSAQEQALGIR
jgi:DNA invertase Pin-like site-specific DNA recombinase/plasmid stability protein